MGDAFAATERLRLANEGSMRENIAGFLADLNSHFTENPTSE
jgi:hypothetical protein